MFSAQGNLGGLYPSLFEGNEVVDNQTGNAYSVHVLSPTSAYNCQPTQTGSILPSQHLLQESGGKFYSMRRCNISILWNFGFAKF